MRQVPELEKMVASRIYSPGPAADIKLIKLIVSYMHNAPELDDDVREIAKRIEIQLAAKK